MVFGGYGDVSLQDPSKPCTQHSEYICVAAASMEYGFYWPCVSNDYCKRVIGKGLSNVH